MILDKAVDTDMIAVDRAIVGREMMSSGMSRPYRKWAALIVAEENGDCAYRAPRYAIVALVTRSYLSARADFAILANGRMCVRAYPRSLAGAAVPPK